MFLQSPPAPAARMFDRRSAPEPMEAVQPRTVPRPVELRLPGVDDVLRRRAVEWPGRGHYFQRKPDGSWRHAYKLADGTLKFDDRAPVSAAEYARMVKLYPAQHTPSFA
jgi:hypothetical protein